MSDPTPPPVTCTLTRKDLEERSIEWADVRTLAISHERLADGARSVFAAAHAEAVEDLAARERSCCGSWLQVETWRVAAGGSTSGEELTMECTTTNPDGVALIHSMVGLSA